MAAKIRVGIVGATVTPGGSGWGANAHVPALKALSAYELKAVCTAHPETASAKGGILRVAAWRDPRRSRVHGGSGQRATVADGGRTAGAK